MAKPHIVIALATNNINLIKIINLQAVYRFLRLFFLCNFEVIWLRFIAFNIFIQMVEEGYKFYCV